MRINLWMLCLVTSVAIAATAEAQSGFVTGDRGLGVVGIAGNEAVQKELQLSAEATVQLKAVSAEFNTALRDAMDSWRASFGDFGRMTQEERIAAMSKMVETITTTADKFVPKLKEVLTADQFTRVQQIHWQSLGMAALSDPEVVKAIPLSPEQQDQIKSINKEYATLTVSSTFDRTGGVPKTQEQNKDIGKERDARITEVLTKDQQDKFASLKGKPFDLSQLKPFGGGGPGSGGRGRGGPGGVAPGDGVEFGGKVTDGVVAIAGNEAVQKELGLSAEATEKVKAVSAEFGSAIRDVMTSRRGDPRDMTEKEWSAMKADLAEKRKATASKFLPKLKDVLTADQFTRLQQIYWQSLGTAALSEPEVVKAIPISKEQQEQIWSINAAYAAQRTEPLISGGPGVVRIEAAELAKIQIQNRKLDNERDAKITEVLTQDQLEKFASIKGKAFDLRQLSPFGRGGRGGGVRGGPSGASS